jgi:hypothetical protein
LRARRAVIGVRRLFSIGLSAWLLGLAMPSALPGWQAHAHDRRPTSTSAANGRSDRAALERKFRRIRRFETGGLSRLVARSRRILARPAHDEATAVALILETMRITGTRVGSHRYAERAEDPTYGASSLRRSHVRIARDGRSVRLRFPGKGFHADPEGRGSSRPFDVTIHAPLLVRAYRVFAARARGSSFLFDDVARGRISGRPRHARRTRGGPPR